jgi:LuxR family transcriptional regulator, maltose regulon positive regulatory protein
LLPSPESFREPLLKTKLSAPQLRARLVHRPRLLGLMVEGAARALTLICAPAGYGKTTFLTDWIAGLNRGEAPGRPAVGWVALDEEDNNPVRFLRYLVAAIENAAAYTCGESRAMLNAFPPPPLKSIMAGLINELTELPGPICLVLDDYQFISAAAIHAGLVFFLDRLPPALHLIIATRSDPPLPLARLRARNQLTEIRAEHLRFTSGEAAAFLNQVMNLSLTSEAVSALEARTEGWIAGLQMAALSMQGRSDYAPFVQAFSGSHRYILDYLADEVLNHQSEEVQHFLILTSILDRLCASLCGAVAEETETLAREKLDYLDRANLYLIALDDERCWYRFHHLFADLLRARLKQSQPDLISRLHGRASEWYAQKGLYTEAIQHAFLAGDYERAADLIELHGPPLWTASDPSLLMLASRLPAGMLRTRPKLGIYQAWLWIAQGQAQDAIPLLHDLAGRLPAQAASPDSAWMRSVVELFTTYITLGAETTAPKPLPDYHSFDLIPEQDLGLHDTAAVVYAMLAYQSGDAELAAELLSDSVQRDLACHGLLAILMGVPFLARVRLMQGRLREAAALCREYLAPVAGSEKSYFYGAGGLAIILGEVLREWNDLEGAEAHIREGIRANEPWNSVLSDMIGYSELVRVQLAKGDLAGAQESLGKLEQKLQGRTYPPEMENELSALRVRLWLAQGDFARADQWADRLRLGEAPDPQRELDLLTLSRVRNAEGRYSEAQHVLETMARIPGLEKRTNRHMRRFLLLALALSGQDLWSQAFRALEACLSLAEPNGYMRAFLDEGERVRALLQAYRQSRAPSHGAYIEKLLAAFPKPPQASPGSLPQADSLDQVTPRELEVLRLMAEGLSNHQIAAKLVIAEGTVKYHVHNILAKLQVHSRTQALVTAKEQKLI